MTFGITFFLTIIAVPFILAGSGQENISGGAFVVYLLGALTVGLPLLMKSIIVAAVVFFVCYRLVSLLLPKRLVFVASAVIAAYVSASTSIMVNIDFLPPAISFDSRSLAFASMVGLVAGAIAAFVASMQMVTVRTHE